MRNAEIRNVEETECKNKAHVYMMYGIQNELKITQCYQRKIARKSFTNQIDLW